VPYVATSIRLPVLSGLALRARPREDRETAPWDEKAAALHAALHQALDDDRRRLGAAEEAPITTAQIAQGATLSELAC
jgi:hypothetical protein